MKFKATKIATAVAAGLGISAIGISAAHADRIMFPYVGGSATVASIITVVNQLSATLIPPGAPGSPVGQLHYQLFHKSGSAANDNAAECFEDSVFRATSANDIVTFDLTGHFGDANGVLFEPSPSAAKYVGTFALLEPVLAAVPASQPRIARGWLMVDNLGLGAAGPQAPNTLNGEAFLLDFVEGAGWGYVAYHPSPNAPNTYDFSDAVETGGEVIAGGRRYNDAALRAGAISHSPRVPVAIYPLVNGDITSQFVVTPINHDVVNTTAGVTFLARSNRSGQTGQNTTNLRTRVGLSVLPVGSSLIAFDRDEQAIDGTAATNVTCVGTVRLDNLFSPLAQSQLATGGWTSLRVTSPGPLVENIPTAPTAITPANGARRTFDTNEAVVMKLEYNLSGQFLTGQNFKGAFNNAYWLRRGAKESLSAPIQTTANVQPFAEERAIVELFYNQLGAIDPFTGEPVDLGPNYTAGQEISFVQ